MMKISHFIYAIILICIFSKCSLNTQELIILENINLFNDPAKNEQIGKDLMYYDYAALIKDSLKITDPTYLQNIQWEYFVTSDTKEVTFKLNLENEAISKKKELVALFDHFVTNRLGEYKIKEKDIDTAVSMGYYYIDLINQHDYNSLWSQTSPLIEKYATKEQFTNMLKNRNSRYKFPGKIKVEGRIVFNEIDNSPGDFYIIYYTAGNKVKEKVEMIKVNHMYKLVGYYCAIPN